MPSRNIPNRADAAKEAPRCRAYRWSSGMPPRTKPSEGASSCEGPSLPSAIPDADSEHTASVPVQPIRVHSGCRTVDTQNRPANGRQPGTPGTQLRWQTVTGTRSGSSEMLGVPRPYTTPCGLLKQPDKQKAARRRMKSLRARWMRAAPAEGDRRRELSGFGGGCDKEVMPFPPGEFRSRWVGGLVSSNRCAARREFRFRN